MSSMFLRRAARDIGSSGANSDPRTAKPTWEQDFSTMPDGPLDSKYWNIDTGNTIPGYNNEAQTLTDRPENVRIRNGVLEITARKEALDGRQYTSGRVNTQDKFSFTHGRLEFDIMSAGGIGTWPAAWLLANGKKFNPTQYGVPAKDNPWPLQGEIDVFETVGALRGGQIYPDIHTYHTETTNRHGTVHKKVGSYDSKYHSYGIYKTPDYLAFTIDGKEFHRIARTSDDPREWPFEQPYYIILNLAMGGSWGGIRSDEYPPDGIAGTGPWKMCVRAVRYYADIPGAA